MRVYLLASLINTLSPHFDSSKIRVETMAILLIGVANGLIANLSHLASSFSARHSTSVAIAACSAFSKCVRLDGWR